MRRYPKLDANQDEIVMALERAGCSVQSLAYIGKGCPDLLVGRIGETYLLEVKDGSKPPSAQVLTLDETKWHNEWRGKDVVIVRNRDEALAAVRINL